MKPAQDQDAMVIVAALVSRVEALVVASMLEAGGVQVCVGGSAHASVSVNSLVLGGHRLWIPASQLGLASDLILEVLGNDEWSFSYGARRAVLKFAGFLTGIYALGASFAWACGAGPVWAVFLSPLGVIGMPVNPQGRGDYYLVATAD